MSADNGGRMKITKEWLEGKKACGEGVEWFINQEESDGLMVVKKLIKKEKLEWANWLIVRIMKYKNYVSYAVYAAEQVIAKNKTKLKILNYGLGLMSKEGDENV